MDYKALLKYEKELKTINLIEPITFTKNDYKQLYDVGVDRSKIALEEIQFTFEDPLVQKVIRWSLLHNNEEDRSVNNTFFQTIRHNKEVKAISLYTVYHGFTFILLEYHKYRRKKEVEYQNDKLKKWYTSTGEVR